MDRNTHLLDLYLATKEVEGRSPLYLRNIRLQVGSFLALAPEDLAAWRRDHLVLWLAQESRGHKPATIAGRQRVVWAYVGWLYEQGDLEKDIRRGVRRVTVPVERHRSVDGELFERLLYVARQRPTLRDGRPSNPQHYWRNLALLHMLWSTGARRSELAAIRIEDVDLRGRTALLRGAAAKNRRARTLVFDVEAGKAIAAYVARERGRADGPLFCCTSEAIRGLLRRLERQTGLDVSAHDFRRGFAARVRKAGLDLGHTAQLLGHRSLRMVQVYSQGGEETAAIAAYRERLG